MSDKAAGMTPLHFASSDAGWFGRRDRVAITFLDRRAGLAVRASREPRLAAGFGIVQVLGKAERAIGCGARGDG